MRTILQKALTGSLFLAVFSLASCENKAMIKKHEALGKQIAELKPQIIELQKKQKKETHYAESRQLGNDRRALELITYKIQELERERLEAQREYKTLTEKLKK